MEPLLHPLALVLSLMSLTSSPPEPDPSGGKWPPDQLLEHDPEWLRRQGLELPAEELWKPATGGLLSAVVQFGGGCTAGFVSAEGLLLTNHHCAFSVLQEHSTPERDLIRDGFVATDRAAELTGTGLRVSVPHRFVDVTAEIEAAVPADADDLERFRAIDRHKKTLVAACESHPHRRCRVATEDDGVRYLLVETLEFSDVRLAYGPPRQVGEFGGEVDNWSWPRHSGDFALLRVYADADNQPGEPSADHRPYRPPHSLKIARQGITKGDFVAVAGYPGKTYRSLIAAEMAELHELYFPHRSALYRDWIDILEAAARADEEAAIQLAARSKSLANREKNSRGQIWGIERGQLLADKRALEARALAWAENVPRHQPAVAAYREIETLTAEARTTIWERDFLLGQIDSGPADLQLAVQLARRAMERTKPDAERLVPFQDRNRQRLLDGQIRGQQQIHPPTEERLLADLLTRFSRLPAGQRVPAVEALLSAEPASDRGPEVLARRARELSRGSVIHALDARREMFDESLETLRGRQDPLLDFALDLARDLADLDLRRQRHSGAMARLRPPWRRALRAFLDRPLDPDANGTLRLSLARVRGYRPRDGVWMEPQTRLGGVVEKHTGEPPFDVPEALLEQAPNARQSRWADPRLGDGDVPVCFLATGDTTGGSSGSPVLNARGELVGINFDRVWENVANDFGYNPEVARNVSVDIRYLLFMLESVEGPRAQHLLAELLGEDRLTCKPF